MISDLAILKSTTDFWGSIMSWSFQTPNWGAKGFSNLHSPENTTVCGPTKKPCSILETQVMTAWLCARLCGFRADAGASGACLCDLTELEGSLPTYSHWLTETTAKYLEKFAEVIAFAEDNWTLSAIHSHAGWVFYTTWQEKCSPEHPFHTALRSKSFLTAKFDVCI